MTLDTARLNTILRGTFDEDHIFRIDHHGARRERGRSFPLGASLSAGGVNVSVFSKHATAVQLLLFDHGDRHPRGARRRLHAASQRRGRPAAR